MDGRPIAESERSLAGGLNDVSWNLDIDNPALWWPRSLGDQPLTEMSIEVMVDGELSDRRERRTGLREVAWNEWVCSVNGERLFLKGANLLPTRVGTRRRHTGRDASRHRARGRRRARRAAGPRPHRPASAVRRGRRARDAVDAGLPAALGVREERARPGGRPGAGCRRSARPPSLDRDVDRAQRPGRGRHRHRGRQLRAAGSGISPPTSCRHGTRRSSTAG